MQNKRNVILLMVLGAALVIGWVPLINWISPPPKPPPPNPKQESVAIVAGGMSTAAVPVRFYKHAEGFELPKAEEAEPPKKEPAPAPEPEMAADGKCPELIGLGWGEKPYYLKVLLTTWGGAVQQVIVSEFPAANREGKEVLLPNGKPKPLHLIPGTILDRQPQVREPPQTEVELQPGIVGDPDLCRTLRTAGASYVMYHYDKSTDDRPLNTLGECNWDVVERSVDPDADEQKVVFRTELSAPHNLVITKTFTLKRKDYHIGLKVDIKRIEGRKGPEKFRYQMTGAHGLPIEGEWYTSIYRQAIVGFADGDRYIDDAATVRKMEGSDRQKSTSTIAIRYAAVAIQYFASVLAVDDQQEKRNFLEFVRATPVGPTTKDQPFLDDVTVRAGTEEFNPDQETTHKYLLYNGPVKVRLLRQMPKDDAVDDALVTRYLDDLNLKTMTDAHMNNFLGKVAGFFHWTDLVIWFTNLIHSLLYLMNKAIPSLGICIMIITVLVRGSLFPLSRRQARNTQLMQAKMAKLTPELKKLQEKYKDDFNAMNQARMQLYKEHGVNPFAAMGGCLLVFLQTPVFMGLYYALQESVFFRLQSFLWMPNLAAPDMLIWWSESIPYISEPKEIGSTWYLGPYLNILPIVSVVLMMFQQKSMMPVSDDPQVVQQQKMMKFMMIFMGLFFYKVASGLCIYFIVSTLWGFTERKILPKFFKPKEQPPGAAPPGGALPSAPEPPKPLGWWGRRKALWKEKWEEVLASAQKQAEHRRPEQRPQPNGPERENGSAGKKKKKKKRK